jgi:hypothetical protein
VLIFCVWTVHEDFWKKLADLSVKPAAFWSSQFSLFLCRLQFVLAEFRRFFSEFSKNRCYRWGPTFLLPPNFWTLPTGSILLAPPALLLIFWFVFELLIFVSSSVLILFVSRWIKGSSFSSFLSCFHRSFSVTYNRCSMKDAWDSEQFCWSVFVAVGSRVAWLASIHASVVIHVP